MYFWKTGWLFCQLSIYLNKPYEFKPPWVNSVACSWELTTFHFNYISFNTVMFLVSSVLQQHILCFSKLRQCPLYTDKCYIKNQTSMALFWDTSVTLLQNHSFGISRLHWGHDALSVAEQLRPNNCMPCFLNWKVSSLHPLHTCKHYIPAANPDTQTI